MYFIASDIHGSLDALERTLELAQKFKADKIFLLGDIFGAHAAEMVQDLNRVSNKLTIVRGNNDWYFDEKEYGADFTIFEKTYQVVDGRLAYLSHGHRTNLEQLSTYGAKMVIIGHLHRPILRYEQGVLLLCPGSMAQPRSLSGKTFATIIQGKVQIRDENGEIIQEQNL